MIGRDSRDVSGLRQHFGNELVKQGVRKEYPLPVAKVVRGRGSMVDKLAERPGLIPSKFYRRIVAAMPIVCVDLMVVDVEGRLLLLRRGDEPVKGHWWFPGGRVHLGETRAESALRKLSEECGLRPDTRTTTELITADVILSDHQGGLRHGVTTVFRIEISKPMPPVQHDEHSQAAEWRLPAAWLRENLHPFVRRLVAMETDIGK
jgi:ADP-ribose pyrophosphatase YjhB (NUDIX family)